jgi:RNA recognition motif-containing protein
MFRQALLLLLVSSASAFTTSPFGGCRALSQKVLQQSQLLSEPNGATEQVNESAVEITEPVDESAAVVEIAEESAEGSQEKKVFKKPPSKDDKERFTAFVGNLPFSMTSNELRDLFAQHGDVLYVSLPLRKETGQARGFAFVDMISKEVLDHAMEAINGNEVGGRMIRVVQSLPQDKTKVVPKKFDEGMKKVYVGNIPFECSIEHLKEYFAEFGTVRDVYIPLTPVGKPRGFAFVSMGEQDIDSALAATDGQEFMGRKLTVSLPLHEGMKKVYVGNIPFECSIEHLKEYFAEFGTVRDVYIPLTPVGKPRGFAFVSMGEQDIDSALAATDGQEFMGRKLTVSLPLPPGEKAPRRPRSLENDQRKKLYIGNLSFYTVPDTVAEVFEEFGTVHDCYLPEDPVTGSARGFGFVTMDNEAADRAILELDGCDLDGRNIRVNEAMPKGKAAMTTFEDEDEE